MALEPEEIIENPENLETTEEAVAAPQGEQPEPEEEKKVPLAALREARAKLKSERDEKQQLALRVAQMEGFLSAQQNNQRQAPVNAPKNYDPEVYELVKPILEEYMSPAQAKIASLEAALDQERAFRSFEQRKAWVIEQLPYLDEIRDELRDELLAMSPEEQQVFENNERALVRLARAIRGEKGAKPDPAVKQIAKASAKGISGTSPASKHADTTRTVDPLALNRDDFTKKFGKGWLE
jgi:hypothetical protein